MSQDNQFHQYGYDHYLKAPQRPSPSPMRSSARSSGFSGGMRSHLARKLQSPAVATVALLAAGAMFVGVIYATYPSGDDAQRQIPIVQADLRPIKSAPEQRGGMDIPHRESTILAHVGQPPQTMSGESVENLLMPVDDGLMSKEEEITQAMASFPGGDGMQEAFSPLVEDRVAHDANVRSTHEMPVLQKIDKPRMQASTEGDVITLSEVKEVEVIKAVDSAAFDIKEPSADNILQKIGSGDMAEDKPSSEFQKKVARAAVVVKPSRNATIHAAGTSPDTIDFVRSVLNKDTSGSSGVSEVRKASPASIEPAAGAAASSRNISGGYFVQLASITDPARAGKEWTKMQAKYDVLSSSKFRVQEASLSKGTFYRIQAGPMSKQSADEMCRALKAMNKPGGCLVVK